MSSTDNAAAIRSFRVLEILAMAGRPMPLSEVVKEINLPKQTVHRILKQLEAAWLIVQVSDSKKYECSARIRHFSLKVLMSSGSLAVERHALLSELVERVELNCNLTAISGHEIIYLDRAQHPNAMRLSLKPGSHVPMHCSASGKLLLSLLPKQRRDRLLHSLPLRARTAQSIVEPEVLDAELTCTRKRRYGTSRHEHVEDMNAIAVPVQVGKNRICAAVAVQAFEQERSFDQLMELMPTLQQTAGEIAKTFL
ncbi:IclR family transcriptional regulator [Advenella kashmirensis W13003]|uniref:IclR family transcriptional regulator n=1 Tax=Advenella kashmirensis W13003 TaxID=1424334 RepID=V8QV86_9BURK|nr:IclR family transcriptional regulator [Advenella kashmirensis]ETF02914.1 IclR family transcriptional regulator [Advenella kashmirensis W13003]